MNGEKFLNGDRAAEFWQAVEKRSLPTKAMSQAEYEALSEAEKNAEALYMTPETGGGSGGGAAGEVYSTEETQIGIWAGPDGVKKPLYRKAVYVTIPAALNQFNPVSTDLPTNIERVVNTHAVITDAYDTFAPVPYADILSGARSITYSIAKNGTVYVYTSMSDQPGQELFIVVEYTKTAD